MRGWARIGGLLVCLVVPAAPAAAQNQPQGVFGAQDAVPRPPQTLDLSATLSGAYDSHVPQFRARVKTPDANGQALYYNDVQAGLWYTRRGHHTVFSANGVAGAQQYPQIANTIRQSALGAVAFQTTTQRSSFRVEQRADYRPFHGFRVVPLPTLDAAPADIVAPDVALAVSGRESYEWGTVLGWDYRLTDRSTIGAEYYHDYLNFVSAGEPDWRTQDIGFEWRHDLAPRTAFVAGYNYHRRDFQDDVVGIERNDLNIGLNYGSTLPFSRRTTFNVSVGSTSISTTPHDDQTDRLLVRLIGQADLDHQLGRTWHLGLEYNRGWQYIEGLPDPFFAYSMTGTLSGYLGPRVDVLATTGYSTGGLRFSSHQRAYNTQASKARLRVGVSRHFAVQAEYVYYHYLFGGDVTLPTGTLPRENRHVFRLGLTTWFPLLS